MRGKRIKPVSDKRSIQLDTYKLVRIEYLMVHVFCEVLDCTRPAIEIHHRRGRSGEQLNKKEDFLAVCRECHDYIENHPDWAKANDYSRSRLWTN